MDRKIHTIVCDLDGTLLNEKSEISNRNLSTIQKVMDAGIHFMIATGRRYHSALPHIARFKGKVQVIANNGQILKEYPEDIRVEESYLPESAVGVLCDEILTQGFFPLLHVDWFEKGIDLLLQENSSFFERYLNHARAIIVPKLNLVNHSRTTVICAYSKKMEDLEALASKIFTFTQKNNLRIVLTTIHNVGPCLEILPANVSKWTGILKFLKLNQKDPHGVLSFGDEANDLEMIQESGIGVAMKNAIPELKQVAKLVTDYTNSEDGVSDMIEKVVIHGMG